MQLRRFLESVGTTYDRSASLGAPAQQLLRRADVELSEHVPGGMTVIGSGGKGKATFTPWVGVFDPDETIDPQQGIYIVYLFGADLASVTLMVIQGMEQLRRSLGDKAARMRLAQDAETIRGHLPADATAGLSTDIDLGSTGSRQRNYQAGNVIAKRYLIDALPTETDLQRDLDRFLELYARCIEAKRELLVTHPGAIASPSPVVTSDLDDPLSEFKPKSDADYETHIIGRRLRKTRRHETLIRQYGDWIAGSGYVPSTAEHPKDLVLRRSDDEWLVEAKVLYLSNATNAVRAALGQLLAYRHFLYPRESEVRLLALFTESIGAGYVEFLQLHRVESVWRESGHWAGSTDAVAHALAEPSP